MGISRREFLKSTIAASIGLCSLLENDTYAGEYKRDGAKTKNNPKPKLITAPKVLGDSLELMIANHISELTRKGLIANDEKISFYVYDFTEDKELIAVNADETIQAASMIKPFIALAYLDEISRGNIAQDSETLNYVEWMIRRSDNVSTNLVIERIGGPGKVQSILSERYGHIFQQTQVIDYIPIYSHDIKKVKELKLKLPENIPSGKSYYSNLSSAKDYFRFLDALLHDQLPDSAVLKQFMSQTVYNRLVSQVFGAPKELKLYNKTGTTARVCGDIALLEGRDRFGNKYFYTTVAVIEKSSRVKGGLVEEKKWVKKCEDNIRHLSAITLDFMKQRYKLI